MKIAVLAVDGWGQTGMVEVQQAYALLAAMPWDSRDCAAASFLALLVGSPEQ